MRDKLLDILAEIIGTDEVRNNPDIRIFEQGLLDSFGIIQLFIEINEQLNIEIAPTEVDREMWATPNKIIAYLEERVTA
ncbi:MAG: D-alanine--poly(phosphoribitol) ligase subunit 2 [Desulfitobacterium hafniense]|nr:D-alanine--poly(phosphoribitol) ligase subunit 2 [Desulfitobacterium hafniense]